MGTTYKDRLSGKFRLSKTTWAAPFGQTHFGRSAVMYVSIVDVKKKSVVLYCF